MYHIGILNKITCPDVERDALGDSANISCFDAKCDLDLPEAAETVDAAIIFHRMNLTKVGIDKLAQCKLIVCASVGYDNVDINYAKEKHIPVINVPDYGVDDVADHTMALFLSHVRKIKNFSIALEEDVSKNWNPQIVGEYHRITDKHFGIIGLGRIGTAVALRAKAFGLNVSYYDPYKPDGYEKVLHIRKCKSLLELISTNKFISIHVPLTDKTRNMITTTLLSNTANGTVIINTARGSIISNATILEALDNNYIEAYLADVLEVEPPSRGDKLISKYLKSGKLLITPHSAAYAVESLYEMRYRAASSALNYLRNKLLCNCVNMGGHEYGVSGSL